MHAGRFIALALPVALLIGCTEQQVPTATSDAPAQLTVANSQACAGRGNNTVDKLLECVTLDGVRSHLAAFQAIADANGGTRASGTPGFARSAEYVASTLEAAGYQVSVQPFQFQAFINLLPPLLEQVVPAPAGALPASSVTYSGSGDVTADVTHVLDTGVPGGAGCAPADFAGYPAGNIALIQRGACNFSLKATNAYNAGASGVVIYNNIPGPPGFTLGSQFTLDLPVLQVTQALGLQLAATAGLVVRVRTSTFRGITTSANIFAETPDGDADNVVMVGAHLDAVSAGPGVQDNGSGSAAILETAVQMAGVKPRNKVRFAWWGAEESGLIGSNEYVWGLSYDDLNRIALYLNFDMIGSPNHVFGVYDGNNSGSVGHPAGSGAIEALFASYFQGRGLPIKDVNNIGFSDHTAFAYAGIPVGGLFTGAGGIKTVQEATIWGGTAGVAYDPCYHQACDTYDNFNLFALEVNVDAAAFATLSLAMSTTAVNGGKGKGNFKAKSNNGGTGSSTLAQQ